MAKTKDEAMMWPSAVVVIALLVVIGAITITAMVRYNNIDDAMRVWTVLLGIIGFIAGGFVVYFFTQLILQQSMQQAQTAVAASTAAQQALARIAGHLEPKQFQTLLADATISKAFGSVEK